MRSRSLLTAVLALALCPGSGCVPSGAGFSPTTGVLTITGTSGADNFVVRANANGSIVVNGGAVPISGGVPTVANTVRITMLGLAGDDQLVLEPAGRALPDAKIIGGPGTDILVGGSGDDEFDWAPGDGLDTVEGQAGTDTLLFQGSNDAEDIDISANGGRALFFRSVGNVTIDLNDVEAIDFLARGASDTVVVGDLSGTEVTEVRLDLAASAGGGGDGRSDTVTIEGTGVADVVGVVAENGGIRVEGLQATVSISDPEPGDQLIIDTLGGGDSILAGAAGDDAIELVLEGGLGGDTLFGSEGADTFAGGDGDDFVLMGDGDDTFEWNPGDDDDVIEGQDGFDTLLFNGSNAGEVIEVSPNGSRILLFRNVASVTADVNDVEAIDVAALGGADTIVVEDVTGTDLTQVNVALATLAGTGDGQPDEVAVDGTDDDDVALVVGDASEVSVFGLSAQVSVTGAEDPTDQLIVDVFGGEDVVEASGLATPSISLTANGGAMADVLIGGAGDDVLNGEDGDDVLLGGPGADTLDGGSGSNVLIQD
jgi:Ca2+-binding RTX toxin-like protein